jgi:hypothetical protein
MVVHVDTFCKWQNGSTSFAKPVWFIWTFVCVCELSLSSYHGRSFVCAFGLVGEVYGCQSGTAADFSLLSFPVSYYSTGAAVTYHPPGGQWDIYQRDLLHTRKQPAPVFRVEGMEWRCNWLWNLACLYKCSSTVSSFCTAPVESVGNVTAWLWSTQGACWMGGWVEPNSGLDATANKKVCTPLPGIEPLFSRTMSLTDWTTLVLNCKILPLKRLPSPSSQIICGVPAIRHCHINIIWEEGYIK